jgi:RNA polymerase sigma-70 factor (ECF subfamily)
MVIFARLRDRHAVDEVLQETALAASRHCHPADADGLRRWLYRVAVRQTLLYRRRTARRDQRIRRLVDAESTLPPPSLEPEQLFLASEQRQLVNAALDKLNRRDCEILLLKYIENWSCRQIADRLGVSETAVKSRLLRARKGLRSELLRLNHDWVLP